MIPLRRDRPLMRTIGVGMGLAFLALGVAALGERAIGFGVIAVVAGLIAVVGSLTVADPARIW